MVEGVVVSSPMLTIFTSPKPFEGHIGIIQENAVDSWLALGESVEVLVIGDEPGMEDVARSRGLLHLRDVRRNAYGTPLLSSIFGLASKAARASILCYANADILLLPDLLEAVAWVSARLDGYLIVGRRWDLEVADRLSFEEGWPERLWTRVHTAGRLHKPAGSDYFVFPKGLFADIPDFALGRAGWDNWMIYAGRARRVPVIDGTDRITVIHQQHDYGHLPGGQPHYGLPESRQNIAMGGGREIVFTLLDCSHRLTDGDLEPIKPASLAGWRRWLLVQAVILLGPGRPARMIRMILHPVETIRYFLRKWSGAMRGTSNEQEQSSRAGEVGG